MTSIKRSTTLSLACGALLALAVGSVALATHARPGGGSPFRVPLVVAYNQCGGVATAEDPAPSALTNTHVTPLDNDSCVPQAQKQSGTNPPTVTFTAGGICTAPMAACTNLGTVRLDVQDSTPGAPPEDIRISGSSLTGVRCNVATGPGPSQAPFPSNTCAGGVGTGYTGVLLAESQIRITDHSNAAAPNDVCGVGSGASPCETGTVSDLTFIVPLACGGGTCGPAAATINALKPGTVKELQRGNVEIQNVRVMTPGNDMDWGGLPDFPGTGDEDKFLSQGIFLP